MLLFFFIFLLISLILIITFTLWDKLPIIVRKAAKTHNILDTHNYSKNDKLSCSTDKRQLPKYHDHTHKHQIPEKKIYTRPVSINYGINPRPNISFRSNPYIMTNKCPPCPKIEPCPKCPKCPKYDIDDDYNIPTGDWFPVPQSECIV